MRHRLVQRVFEITPKIVVNGLCLARADEDEFEVRRRLREAEVTLDEVARELDFDEIYASAYEEEDPDAAERAAASEIARQIGSWLDERLDSGPALDVQMHRVS